MQIRGKKMYHQKNSMILPAILLCLIIAGLLTSSFCQSSFIDPEQTVNPATGEMMFSLPLGTVQGIGGKDAPITLNYKAGIGYYQEASPAGLGFSYSPGSISKKTVFVNDMNLGGTGNYFHQVHKDNDYAWWYWIGTIFLTICSIAVAIFSGGTGSWVGGFMLSAILSGLNVGLNYIAFSPINYNAGNFQTPSYPEDDDGVQAGNGRGFITGGDRTNDMQDIYQISTPYINGEMVYRQRTGDFVMRSANGCIEPGAQTILIKYNSDESFKITLNDGTKLIFRKTIKSKSVSATYAQDQNAEAQRTYVTSRTYVNEPSIEQWLLTEVLYTDYIDGNGDEIPGNSVAADKGNWIQYDYDQITHDGVLQLPLSIQSSLKSTSIVYQGDLLVDTYLKFVKTPNQFAEFIYSDNRLDDVWFDKASIDTLMIDWETRGNSNHKAMTRENPPPATYCKSVGTVAQPVNRKVLSSVLFYNNRGEAFRRVNLNTDYTLKPHSLHSFTKDVTRVDGACKYQALPGNPDAACLTLKSIDILDGSGNKLGTITLNYDELNPGQFNFVETNPNSGFFNQPSVAYPSPDIEYRAPFFVETKDYWGYYYPNTMSFLVNMFPWNVNESNEPWARAWSLKEIIFPLGNSIGWNYESNKYDMSNQQRIAINGSGSPIGGCGIRVKQVTIRESNNATPQTLDYFYTCSPEEIEEYANHDVDTCNSSGYVAANPFPYLVQDQNHDYRKSLNMAQGGLYTPTKVSYEMVKVAKNYDFDNHMAPNGYAVYEFTSTREYPNEGDVGEIDNSWKRGLLFSISTFNKDKNKISGKKTTFDIQRKYPYEQFVGVFVNNEKFYPYGIITTEEDEAYINGITSRTVYKYAGSGMDAVKIEKLRYLSNCSDKLYDQVVSYNGDDWGLERMNAKHSQFTDFDVTDEFGGSGYDIFTIAMDNFYGESSGDYSYLEHDVAIVMVAEDIPIDDPSAPFTWKFGAMNLPDGDEDEITLYASGMAFGDINGNSKGDAIVTMASYSSSRIYSYIVFYDISDWDLNIKPLNVTPPEVPNMITQSNPPKASSGFNRFNMTGLALKVSGDPQFFLPGITDLTGNTSKDLVIIAASHDFSSYELIILTDLANDGNYTSIRQSDLIVESLPGGNSISSKLIDYDGDGIKNDILMTCLSYVTGAQRQIKKKMLKNVRVEAGKVVYDNVELDYPLKADHFFSIYKDNFDLVTFAAVYPENHLQPVYCHLRSDEYGYSFEPAIIDGRTLIAYDRNSVADTVEKYLEDTVIVTVQVPAYTEYDEMLKTNGLINNILTPACRTVNYKKYNNTCYPVNSAVTTWSSFRSAVEGQHTNWRPVSKYVWNVEMVNGVAGSSDVDFDFSNPDANTSNNWMLHSSVTKYDNSSQPVENMRKLTDTQERSNVTFYGYPGKRLVKGSVVEEFTATANVIPYCTVDGSTYDSCAVYTCDYEDDPVMNRYTLDVGNGWDRGIDPARPSGKTELVVPPVKLFGERAVHVYDAYGPAKNIKYTENKSYVLSAWLWKNSSATATHARLGVNFYSGEPGVETFIGTTNADPLTMTSISEIPQLFKVDINSSLLQRLRNENKLSDNEVKYIRICAGCTDADPACDFYVQDIRCYPTSANLTTTYYNTNLGLPILTVDNNDKPGNLAVYDGFGRLLSVIKLDLTKNSNQPGWATVLESNRYFSGYEDGIVIVSPKPEDRFVLTDEMKIDWINNRGRNVDIYYSVTNGAADDWVKIGTQLHVNGDSFIWQIPDVDAGILPEGSNYGIKVVDVSDQEVFDQAGPLTLLRAKINYPKGNNIIQPGVNTEINYFIPDDVHLYFYVNGLLIGEADNTGTFLWQVPADFTETDNAILTIIYNGNSVQSDNFKIRKNRFIRRHINHLLNK